MITGGPAIKQLDAVIDTRRLPADVHRRMQTNYNAMECYVPGAYSGAWPCSVRNSPAATLIYARSSLAESCDGPG